MRLGPWLIGALSVCLGSLLWAQGLKPGDVGYPYGDLKEVTLRGRLVDLGAEMAKKYGARVAGAGPEKQWALALPKGELYIFLDNEAYRKLVAGKPAEGGVEVQARLIPRSQLIEVKSFRPIPAAAVHQRFYCAVCNIYTDDWGPCECCGKEMEPVKDGQ